MTAPEQSAIYRRAMRLGRQVAHGQYQDGSAGWSLFYLSHTLAQLVPTASRKQHQEFLVHLLDQSALSEQHAIDRAEARVRRAVRPLFDALRPAHAIDQAAATAAAGELTVDELEIVLVEEMAWWQRRRRQARHAH